MLRTLALTLIVSSSLYAQTDLRVEVTPGRIKAGLVPDVLVMVRNDGPGVARDVILDVTVNGVPRRYELFTILDRNAAGYHLELPPQPVGILTIDASVKSSTPDPDPSDNSVTKLIEVSSAPDLVVKIGALPTLDPSLPFPLTVTVTNVSMFTAHDVVLTLDLPVGASVQSLPANCRGEGGPVTCDAGDVASTTTATIAMTVVAPDNPPATFTATAHAVEADFDEHSNRDAKTALLYQTFVVTSTADDGAGSLRQAIRDANAQCLAFDPCAISFQIGEASATPWKTIHIASPLPAISGPRFITIDGTTQTRFGGDTNPDGPEIEISGGGATPGDGLRVETRCSSRVANLAVNGFAGDGLALVEHKSSCFGDFPPYRSFETRSADVSGIFAGTDPTGSVAKANGSRGIATNLDLTYATITGCVTSGNHRSGIYVVSSVPMKIADNRIGVKAHADEPLPNGASGIYIGPPYASPVVDNYLTIENNAVAFNAHFGVAVQPRRTWDPYQPYVQLSRNRIWANAIDAIDVGLDGVATRTEMLRGSVDAPSIISARYDPAAKATIVEGRLGFTRYRDSKWVSVQAVELELFASDTPGLRYTGDAQQFLERIALIDDRGNPLELPAVFRVSIPGDLTNRWLTATLTLEHFDYEKDDRGQVRIGTTELSRPMMVGGGASTTPAASVWSVGF